MNRNRIARACMIATASLALAACTPEPAAQADAPAAAPATVASPVSNAAAQDEGEKCTDEPRTDENDKRPRCGGVATASATHAFHVVGGSGDPVDQVVCDITDSFVLDGKMFGVEFSGGADGTYKFVRTPDIPGLSWKAGGRYHIEFPDGEDMPGTMTTEGGGTTTAGAISRDTAGAEHFTLTPVEACE